MAVDVATQQGKVPDAIQNFVTGTFVVRPKLISDDAGRTKNQQILLGHSRTISLRFQSGHFAFENERSGECDIGDECFWREFKRQKLRLDRRTRTVVQFVGDDQRPAENRARADLCAIVGRSRVLIGVNDQHFAPRGLLVNARIQDCLHERKAGSIRTWWFRGVQLDQTVVNLQSGEGRHDMFD